MSYNKVILLGVCSTAALLAAYIFWGPKKKEKQRRKNTDLCAGLENHGNTCFVNAVLQALSACPSISEWLGQLLRCEASVCKRQYLAATLLDVISGINNRDASTRDTYNTQPLLTDLRRRRWHISPDEQDAHEFFHVVMETLDEEATRYPTVISLFDIHSLQNPDNKYQPVETARTRSEGLLPVLPRRYTDNPFRGLLACQLKCTQCGYQHPVKYGSFDSLSLPIPTKTWGTVALRDLLTNYIQSEHVLDVECPGCAKVCGGSVDKPPRATFIKKTTLAKLPQCLCIHVQRTLWLSDGMPVKCFNRVLFPETLSLDDYAYIKSHGRSRGLCGGNVATRPGSLMLASHRPLLPTDLSPQMNLLRALNFQSQTPSNSFLLQSPSTVAMTTTSLHTDINQNAPNIPEVAQQSGYRYKLMANVCHYGDTYFGHFIACRRAPCVAGEISVNWAYTSDTEVRAMTIAEVQNSVDVYMLFYERL